MKFRQPLGFLKGAGVVCFGCFAMQRYCGFTPSPGFRGCLCLEIINLCRASGSTLSAPAIALAKGLLVRVMALYQ